MEDIMAMRGFNPRARGGRDLYGFLLLIIIYVSIHAPAGGATLSKTVKKTAQEFQSTRPRGARPATQNHFRAY